MKLSLAVLLFAVTASAQTVTHYGSPQDALGDTNSRNGIGNHDNQLVPLQSAALSASVAQQYGIKVGDSFTVTAGGTTYNLQYDDTVPASIRFPRPSQASTMEQLSPVRKVSPPQYLPARPHPLLRFRLSNRRSLVVQPWTPLARSLLMPLSNGCPSSKAMLQPFSGFWLQSRQLGRLPFW